MIKKKLLRRIIGLSIILLLTLSVCQEDSWGQRRRPRKGIPTAANRIPKDKRPWAGIPWVIGITLTAGAVAVSLKNAKRTHLD